MKYKIKLGSCLFSVIVVVNANNIDSAITKSAATKVNISTPLIVAKDDGYASAYGVSAQISTLGVGLNLTRALYLDYLNVRLQADYLQYGMVNSGNLYNFDMNLYGLLLDYMPFGEIFHISGGVYYDHRSIEVSSSSVDIGNSMSASGNAGIRFNQFSPYLGIGFGSQAASSINKKGLLVAFDIGVLFQNPQVFTNLTCNGTSSANCSAVNQQIAVFKDQLQDELNIFGGYYPVIAFGLGYRF